MLVSATLLVFWFRRRKQKHKHLEDFADFLNVTTINPFSGIQEVPLHYSRPPSYMSGRENSNIGSNYTCRNREVPVVDSSAHSPTPSEDDDPMGLADGFVAPAPPESPPPPEPIQRSRRATAEEVLDEDDPQNFQRFVDIFPGSDAVAGESEAGKLLRPGETLFERMQKEDKWDLAKWLSMPKNVSQTATEEYLKLPVGCGDSEGEDVVVGCEGVQIQREEWRVGQKEREERRRRQDLTGEGSGTFKTGGASPSDGDIGSMARKRFSDALRSTRSVGTLSCLYWSMGHVYDRQKAI
ncbi:hypothetical protein B0H10DRAFT_1966349 [Mycena sp. CBHHK59/15]|nr:hypothetical protein B0H10DRAFT_1966349 [Mycena sp. CBHHK59/15]